MRSVFMACACLIVVAANAEGRYESQLSTYRQELSEKMATCAGRQEATAKLAEQAEQPSTAELARRVAASFKQCAWYLRIVHDDPHPSLLKAGETKIDYARRTVDSEAEIAQLQQGSRLEQDRFEEATAMMRECRALDEELNACNEDQKLFVKDAKAN